MRKTHKFIAMFMAVVMATCFSSTYTAKATDADDVKKAQSQVTETKKKIEQLKNQLSSINNDINKLKKVISQLDAQLDEITNGILAYNRQIEAKQGEIDAKNTEIVATELSISRTENNLSIAEAKEHDQYEAMKLRIQYMYECGEESFLDLIFSSKDMSEMLGRAEYIASITEYDRKQLDEYKATKEQINVYLAELVDQKAILSNQKTELVAQKDALVSLKSGEEEQQELVNQALSAKEVALKSLSKKQANVSSNITVEQEELKKKEAAAAAIKAAWEEEQRRLAQQGINADAANKAKLDEIERSGGFYWPIPGYNRVTQQFHGGKAKTHSGTDIGGSLIFGKPIYAAYDGVVSVAQHTDQGGFGIYVTIDHGSGIATLYGHMSKCAVSKGQTVKKGQVIGYVGSSGYSTGPHLHITLMVKGTYVDPLLYFRLPK